MFCTKCGMQIPQDGRFCINCGTPINGADTPKAESADTDQGVQAASSFGTYYTQTYRSNQPPYQQPKKKNVKAIIIACAGIVLAAALTAFLLLTVFTSEGWPFSGKTIQTRFVNDSIAVFNQAFGDINYGKMGEINDKPFDLSCSYNVNAITNGQPGPETAMTYNIAYDNQTLGINLKQDTGTTKLLLVEDTLYIDVTTDYFGESFSYTSSLKFDAKADLSRPMTLNERFAAIFTGGEIDVDFIKLFELFFNSISEECFDKNNTRTILRMDGQDIAQMLDTFAEKISEDKELNESLKNALKKLTGIKIDITNMIPLLSASLSKSDIELVWTVRYGDTGLPKRVEILFKESGSTVFDFGFETNRQNGTRNILMEMSAPGSYQNVSFSIEMELVPKPDSMEFRGSMTSAGETVNIDGSENWNGDDFSGRVNIDIPKQNNSAETSYNGKLSVWNPTAAVISDERFAVDTENAQITDINEFLSMFSLKT